MKRMLNIKGLSGGLPTELPSLRIYDIWDVRGVGFEVRVWGSWGRNFREGRPSFQGLLGQGRFQASAVGVYGLGLIEFRHEKQPDEGIEFWVFYDVYS